MNYQLEITGEHGSSEIDAVHVEGTNHVRIHVCDHWTCHSIDLTKSNVSDLIDALTKMKEVMHD